MANKVKKKGTVASQQKTYKVKVVKEGGIGAYAEGSTIELPKSTAQALVDNKSAEKVGKW